MKNKILLSSALLLIVMLCNNTAYSQWQTVGSLAFSAGQVSYTSMAVDKNGTPYIAFQDQSDDSNKVTVMKYNGSVWVNVGPPRFSFAEADFISLAIDSASGTPYVAYEDQSNTSTGGLTVRKFNGSTWDTLGTSDFTPNDAQYVSLVVYNDTPFVAFEDFNNSYKTTVMKYNGSWSVVGSAGFSAGSSVYVSLAVDHTGKLYIAYQDNNTPDDQATVMTFNGSNWITVGSTGFSTSEADYISLAIDNNNNPVVAFSDNGASVISAATVMTYNGSNWVNVGLAGFTVGEADYVSIAFNKSGVPFVVYSDITNSGKATVMQFNGLNWVLSSTADFSASQADYTSIAVDNSGVVYVGYVDYGNSHAASTKKYDAATGLAENNLVENVSAFPNPGAGNFSVKIQTAQSDKIQLSVYDMLGQSIWKNNPVEVNGVYNTNIDLAAEAKGIYFLQIKTATEVKTIKLEIQK